jgi:hypothetical protein
MGMGLDRATSRGDRPLPILLLCKVKKANDQAHRTQITFATQPSILVHSGAATCYAVCAEQ